MKKLAAVFLIIGFQSLEGCTYVPAVEGTDLSVVREESNRKEIESVLGDPLMSRPTNDGSISVYEYDIEEPGEWITPDGGGSGCGDPVSCILLAPAVAVLMWVSTPFIYAGKAAFQDERYLVVVYSADDKVVRYYEGVTGKYIDHTINREAEYQQLKMLAEKGDPDAMYEYAYVSNFGAGLKRIKWFCRAAHTGHAKAQYYLGNYYYRWAEEQLPSGETILSGQDAINAYVWYTLAFDSGFAIAQSSRDRIFEKMNPTEIAQAERLVAEWKPNSAECDVIGGENPTAKASATSTERFPAPETAALSASPTLALWNGKWFAKDGAWSLYMEVENGVFTGSALRRGSDKYHLAGTISPEYLVAGRIEDGEGAPTGSLSGMFPNVSVYQDGRMQASFNLERRE